MNSYAKSVTAAWAIILVLLAAKHKWLQHLAQWVSGPVQAAGSAS